MLDIAFTVHVLISRRLLLIIDVFQDEVSDKGAGKKGKVVLYVTSVQMVRSTRDLCKQVTHILKAYRVRCSVKDVYLHPAYNKELTERLGGRENVALPQASLLP